VLSVCEHELAGIEALADDRLRLIIERMHASRFDLISAIRAWSVNRRESSRHEACLDRPPDRRRRGRGVRHLALLGVLLAFIFCAAAVWALRNPAPERAPVRARRGRR
jgi:hypothetical protein